MAAYTRRKRWEAELQAGAISKVIAEMFGGAKEQAGDGRVSADSLLSSMGVKVE